MDQIEIYNPKLLWNIMPDKEKYLIILMEQGVSKFNPIEYYNETKICNNDEKVKLSKNALKIINSNKLKKKELLKTDENNRILKYLDEYGNLEDISSKINSMITNYGKIKLKLLFLNEFLSKNYHIISYILYYSIKNDIEINDDDELIELKNNVIKKFEKKYDNYDLIKIQMNNLSSYLPPLDPFDISKYKLDDWQLDVFKMIESKENILICAPTSAGKTVCSTYCSVIYKKTLFVVPSDELARQVGGIFRNLSNISVKIITNKEYFNDINYNVLVGTPKKIEDYIVLNNDEFDYVIIDEWHMVNSNEGDSLEKIFKLINSPFLILSATLESPNNLKKWMELIKKKTVNLIEYKKRFIVQQRFIWTINGLKQLHPLSCINLDDLKSNNFIKFNLQFTPKDTYDLFEKINKYKNDYLSIKNLINKDKWDRITLDDSKNIEIQLKQLLCELSIDDEQTVIKILEEYKNTDEFDFDIIKLIHIILKNDMHPAIFFKVNSIKCLQVFKSIVNQMKEHQDKKYPFHNEDLEFRQSYYLKYIEQLEIQKNKVILTNDQDISSISSNLEKNLEQKFLNEMKSKFDLIIKKRIHKITNDENKSDKVKNFYNKYYNKLLKEVNEQKNLYFIDKNRPHPDFCFNNLGIDSVEMRKIKKDLCKSLNEKIDYEHPFLIGIERGIMPYFKDMEVPYQRIAQSLFSQRKIPIIISDESLGYGINLPIKTVVLLGNENIENIDITLANQMMGRSGRRGIDREGNIIFLGVNWENILRGKYEKLVGKNIINNYLPLPFYFKKLDKDKLNQIFTLPLNNFTNNINYRISDTKKHILKNLDQYQLCKNDKLSLVVWSCRKYNNSFLLPYLINNIDKLNSENFLKGLISIYDKSENLLDDNYISDLFELNNKQLYDYKELYNIYKKNAINNTYDIEKLKILSNIISILHILYYDNNKFKKILEDIFNNIKSIIKKNLF